MSQTDDLIQKLIKNLDSPNYVEPENIPNIDLYMDQVTTFMNKYLDGCKRSPDDKILTKTMINNYAKNNILPSPDKKKYTKDHIIILIFIYYLKGFLSINDIQSIINPLIDGHFNNDNNISLANIYSTIFSLEKGQLENWKEDLTQLNELSKTVFNDVSDSEILQTFSLICLLSFDVYMRKKTIETLIDTIVKQNEDTESKTDKKEKKEKEKKEKKAAKAPSVN